MLKIAKSHYKVFAVAVPFYRLALSLPTDLNRDWLLSKLMFLPVAVAVAAELRRALPFRRSAIDLELFCKTCYYVSSLASCKVICYWAAIKWLNLTLSEPSLSTWALLLLGAIRGLSMGFVGGLLDLMTLSSMFGKETFVSDTRSKEVSGFFSSVSGLRSSRGTWVSSTLISLVLLSLAWVLVAF